MRLLCSLLLLGLHLHAGEQTFPKLADARRIRGELVSADFVHRSGQFRTEKGELMDFTMPPYGIMRTRGSDSDMREMPLGTNVTFVLLPDAEGRPTRLATTEDGQPADEAQWKKFVEFTKARGISGWIDKTEGNLVTVTFFSGNPARFKQTWPAEFAVGKGGGKLCVANDELRTWNPPVDGEGFSIVEVHDVPTDAFGSSGFQVVLKVSNMLEGFRRGRVVRVFAPGWKAQDQFYGESLMGYGFERLQTADLLELQPKEYPDQFPFRTDYGNAHLPWYQLKPGVPPPRFSEHLVFGELVKVDAEKRTGQFCADRTGKLVDFTLIAAGPAVNADTKKSGTKSSKSSQTVAASVRYLNADASISDLPPGARCRFHMYQDEKGAFTKASFISDEFSYLAANALTYSIESLKLAEGKLHVARQIPEVKNYNGDMERPPAVGRTELRVSAETRVWKGEQQLKLTDLAVGDALLINLTGELPGKPSRCTDIWVGTDTDKLVTEQRSKKPKTAKR